MSRDFAGREFDVIIVGAGIVGTVMASLLVARKLCGLGTVAIIADRIAPQTAATGSKQHDWNLRVFALSRASERILTACGVWKNLPRDRCGPFARMCVWDALGGPHGSRSVSFDCADVDQPNLGYIVDGAELQQRCLQSASDLGVVFIEADVQSVKIDEAACRIGVGDGREFRCQLLIAADGTESVIRCLLGIETTGHAYHQEALVAHVRTELDHRDTAYQRFLTNGPLALLPLPDGRSSLVWTVDFAQARRLLALDDAGFNAALTVASGEVLGPCELTTEIASFPLKLQNAAEYVRPRAALIGDAAHVVHPLAGQGLNLGLLDCASLCDVLAAAARSSAFGELRTLRRYERWRRSENTLVSAALDGLERLFGGVGAAASAIRGVGFFAVERLTPLKRELARRALGLSGDLPNF